MKVKVKLNIQKFGDFKTNIEDLITKNTQDGNVDYSVINEQLNEQINKYNSSRQPDIEKLKTQYRTEYEQEIFKGLEIDGVTNQESFMNHVSTIKQSTDENANKVTELQGKLSETQKLYETMETKYKDVEKNYNKSSFKLDIHEQKYNPKYMNAIQAEFKARTEGLEEFDKADIHKAIKEDFPEFAITQQKTNFGNRKPNDNKVQGFGNKKTNNGFYGGKV
jgi:hypothetical protein